VPAIFANGQWLKLIGKKQGNKLEKGILQHTNEAGRNANNNLLDFNNTTR